MTHLLQDLRYALRSFRRAPLVTAVTAHTIAIGVGATTTMLSVANALLVRPPAGVRDPGSLMTVHAMSRNGSSFHAFSYLDLRDLQRAQSGLTSLAGFTVFPASLRTGEDPELRMGMLVTSNYFGTLGTRAARGRFFTTEEDTGPGGPRVVVLSHALWQARFGGDTAIVGRTIELNGQPFTVVGVAEPGFRSHVAAVDVSLWVPVALDPVVSNRQLLEGRQQSFLEIAARAPAGMPRQRIAAELDRTYREAGISAGLDRDRRVDVRSYSAVPGQVLLPVMGFLGLFLILAAMVLLIAAANVANVMLARGSARAREIAVRLAVGAGRSRLVRQLVTESVLLFLVGGAAGTAAAVFATRILSGLQPPVPMPVALDFHVDLRVLLVALGVTLVTGLVFGLAPAFQSTRLDLTRALKNEAAAARVGRFRLRSTFVAAQVAGTTLLLVVAGLFTRALGRTGSVDLGFDPGSMHVMTLEMQVHGRSAQEVGAFGERLIERASALPGVTSVAVTDFLPLNLGNQQTAVALEGRGEGPGVGFFQTDFASVSPGFFDAMSLPLVSGRAFIAADRSGSPGVAIINETLARQIWPGENPVGKQLHFGSPNPSEGDRVEIVGVARDAKYRGLGDTQVAMIYVPLAQQPRQSVALLLRLRPGAPSPAAALKALVRELDPSLPIATNAPYRDIIAVSLIPNRVAVILAGLFGATGLVLAAVGLYGVLSYMVTRRRREIGIRMALGAEAGAVRRLVLRDGLRLTAVGLAVGFVASLGATRLIAGLLFGLNPADPVTYATIATVLGAVAWAACAVPARRALATEPLEVLRHD